MSSDERLVVSTNVEIILNNPEYISQATLNRIRARLEQEAKKVFTEATGFMEGWFKVYVGEVEQKILNKEFCE